MTTERRKMGGTRAGRGRGEGASERKADRFDRGRVKRQPTMGGCLLEFRPAFNFNWLFALSTVVSHKYIRPTIHPETPTSRYLNGGARVNSRLLSWETTPSTEKWWREAHFLLLFSFSPDSSPHFSVQLERSGGRIRPVVDRRFSAGGGGTLTSTARDRY